MKTSFTMNKKQATMVKTNMTRNRRMPGIELFMECTDEALSPSQNTAQMVALYKYEQAIAKIKDAQAKARIGRATIINKVDTVGKVAPRVSESAPKPLPQKTQSPIQKEPDRSSSPDIIFVGETPPSKPRQPVQPPQPRSLVITQRTPTTANGQLQQNVSQQVYKLVTMPQAQQGGQWIMKPVANVMPQQQIGNKMVPTTVQHLGQPVSNTSGLGYKRPLPSQAEIQARKKIKKSSDFEEHGKPKRPFESDESDKNPNVLVNGNWVPLDEYYYGKMEGDPTYVEEKGEFRFKCWYCNKMLYNNVKAMMHIQGHIDSSKQQNIDLSDLTQCKHCYKQFDTPFEMQTHVDKVHMSNTNVLLCRICDRDHETRSALTSHMRGFHNPCEMPYTCQLCKFRSSMYSDVVDHFKKKHDSSQHLLCLYCLRVFLVKFVSQGWGTTQTYYGHLLKHQSKAQTKKCGLCRLAFFNSGEVKAHKQKHHGPNQKAVLGTAAHSTKPDQVLIKVPSSQKLKSLNAPSVSKVLDFGGTSFPGEVHFLNCFECKMSMGTQDHYRKYVECSMCRFATNCSIAYANHMMGFHSGQMSSLNLNIPWERKMPKPMYCLCGFSSRYGNKIANHLVYCMKISCYENKPDSSQEIHREEEQADPRHKPGASLLDALGLVKRRTNTPIYGQCEESPPREEVEPKITPMDPDYVPPELHGSQKWKTVKLKDPATPFKESLLFGKSQKGKHEAIDSDSNGLSERGDNSNKDNSGAAEESNKTLLDESDENRLICKDNEMEKIDENELLKDDENEHAIHSKEDEKMSAFEEDNLLDENEKESVDLAVGTFLETLDKNGEKGKEKVDDNGDKLNDNSIENSEIEKSVSREIEKVDEKGDVSKTVDNESTDVHKIENSESVQGDSSENGENNPVSNDNEVEKIEKDSEKVEKNEEISKDDSLPEDEVKDESSSQDKFDKTECEENESDQQDANLNKNENETVDESLDETSLQNRKDETELEGKSDNENNENETGNFEENETTKEIVEGDYLKNDITDTPEEENIKHGDESSSHGEEKPNNDEQNIEEKDKSGERVSVVDSMGDNSGGTPKKDTPTKSESPKEHGHRSSSGERDRSYHGSRSHDDRRSHDERRSHDRRSYDDRRSHDRHHYNDRSYHHQGRHDDRNRHRRYDDRDYDRGYHEDRRYHDNRDNRDRHRDDRRYDRGQGHYQGHGGYHGYR